MIGDIELFAQARAEPAAAPGGRHHRHQRQVDHHRARSTTSLKTAGVPATMGGNIGLPILGQEPLPDGRRLRARTVELPDRPDPQPRLRCRGAAQRHARPSRPLRRLRGLCGVEGAAVRDAVARACRGDRRPRTTITRAMRRALVRRPQRSSVASGRRARTSRAGRRCRGRTMPRMSPPRSPSRRARASATSNDRPGLDTYPRPAAPDGAGRRAERRPVRQRQQGDQPDLDRAGAGRLSATVHWIVGGLPKSDDLDACAAQLRPCPRRLHDRRGRADVRRGCSNGTVPVEQCELLAEAVQRAPRRGGSRARSSCSRRPAPRSTSSAIMRRAATPSAPRWRRWHESWRGLRISQPAVGAKAARLGRSDTQRARPLVLGDRQASC